MALAFRVELGDLPVDLAQLARGVADSRIGARNFLADRGKGRAPFGDRPRLPFLANTHGGGFRKVLGKLAPRIRRIDRALQIGALIVQSPDALVQLGQVDRRRARRTRVDRADGELCARFTLDPD